MEDSSSKYTKDNERSTKDEVTQGIKGIQEKKVYNKGGKSETHDSAPANVESLCDVNMEAFISHDDVMRAGGLGARDDMNTVLPSGVDMTEFEATLLDARGYEGPPENITRPGLGYHEAK